MSVELMKIGSDYYNPQHLISVSVGERKVTLKFAEGVIVSVTPGNWDDLKGHMRIHFGVDNDYRPGKPQSF